MTLGQMHLECSLRWQLLVAENLLKAGVAKKKELGSTPLLHWVFGAPRSCCNEIIASRLLDLGGILADFCLDWNYLLV